MSAALQLHRTDAEKCRGDAACVETCNKRVLELVDGKARTVRGREEHCFRCGQCVAVCPTGALSMQELPAESFHPPSDWSFGTDQLFAFLEARRSVRSFKTRPVTRATLDLILEGAGLAPYGFQPTTHALVIDREPELAVLRDELLSRYSRLVQMAGNPIGRTIIRLKRGAQTSHSLASHVLRIVTDNNQRAREHGEDRYLYGAPAVVLFHADRWAVSYQENAVISATYAALTAHALGLGATLLSIVGPAINNFPGLRERYAIPAEHEVVIAMIVGYPKYRFRRTIARKLAGARYL